MTRLRFFQRAAAAPRAMLRLLALLPLLPLLGTALPGTAQVLRCSDATGRLSYTDGACPDGARPAGRVAVPAPPPALPDDPERDRFDRGVSEYRSPVPLPPAPAGPAIIDPRGAAATGGGPAGDPRRNDRGSDLTVIDGGDVLPYPGVYRQAPPRDLRPRLRDCTAAGCRDTQGNHYDRSGRLDRYESLDGRTCRPVGTTTVCR